jgi:hypothetical protein
LRNTLFCDETNVGKLEETLCIKCRELEPLSNQIPIDEPNVLKLVVPDASNQQSRPGNEEGLTLGDEKL